MRLEKQEGPHRGPGGHGKELGVLHPQLETVCRLEELVTNSLFRHTLDMSGPPEGSLELEGGGERREART